jgi:ABC-type transport system substrate-binding protein
LTPDTAAARAAGRRYRLTPSSNAATEFLAFNTDRPLFHDIRMRRAVQFALDRRALAEATGNLVPATRLLGPGEIGYEPRPLYPPAGDLRAARRLTADRSARVVVYTWNDPPYTDAFNSALREQLSAIGLRMSVLRMEQGIPADAWLAKARRADLIWGGLNAGNPDPATYLQPLYLPPNDMRELHRLTALRSPARERAADALARRLDRDSLFAVYGTDAVPELVSRRLGCIVHQPEVAGIDLAALCAR